MIETKVVHNEPSSSASLIHVVGIGASAGGLDAFKKMLQQIPENSGIIYLLMQHINPSHDSKLIELLQKVAKIPVVEITGTTRLEADHIYLIPSDKKPVIKEYTLHLKPLKKTKTKPPLPIDAFFTELAKAYQACSIGVVLSGTASDGTQGLKSIREEGGVTFAQDEETATFSGMPISAIQAGVVDFILSPEKMPKKIVEIANLLKNSCEDDNPENRKEEDTYKQILSLLRVRKGTDFTYYKQTTIRRRILRRMALNKLEDLGGYLAQLREHKKEQDILYQDLLIPVTDFFRDPDCFDNLWEDILPVIVKNKGENHLRIWIAGCSTGEEVYSFAMSLKELLDDRPEKIQIFGTDINELAIKKARSGNYAKADVAGLSADRLKNFFEKTAEGYQANKAIREMCVFSVHNFLKDPPFSKMDLISCRNVLIYMESYLQKKALGTFHYALNPKGYLLLGKSETISNAPNLFIPTGKSEKLYIRRDVTGKYIPDKRQQHAKLDEYKITNTDNLRTDFQKTADDIMLSKYTPAGVVVNEAMDIVHFRGSTGNYLEPSQGKASLNILKMAKDSLAFELRSILHKAKKDNEAVVKENILLQMGGGSHKIAIEAMPLPNTIEPHYLILFHDRSTSQFNAQYNTAIPDYAKLTKDEKDLRIKQLEAELVHLREDMRSITEDQEAANEELQSANEELLSSSEELQSLNEELETSKEELQSINEELTVVNQELLSLNEQVTQARDYAETILATTHEPLLVLDNQLRVKNANNSFYKAFGLVKEDIEGSSLFEMANGEWNIPELKNLLVKRLAQQPSITDYKLVHQFASGDKRIMLINATQVNVATINDNLILLFIEDITDKISEGEIRYRSLINSMSVAIYTCNENGVIQFYNEAAVALWGRRPVIGKDLWCGSWKIYKTDGILLPAEECPMAITLKTGEPVTGKEIIVERPDGSRLNILPSPKPIFDVDGKLTGAINTLFDITPIKNSQKIIEENEQRFHFIADAMPQKVWTADAEGNVTYFNLKWFDYSGLTYEELKKWGWKKTIHPDDWEENKKRWEESIRSGKPFELEHRIADSKGEYKWHLSRGLPYRDETGNIKMWIGSNTEIDRVKQEQQRKGDFIKMVSHELKTPVTSIKGYVQLLLMMMMEETETVFPPTLKATLLRIDKLVARLTRLITEMLDLSRIEAGKLELQIDLFNLNELVAETVEDIRHIKSNHQIQIQNDFTCTIYGDKSRIEQVINNLLDNAIKYSANSDTIKVRIHKGKGNLVAVSVIDYGIGINSSDRDQIFDRFYRVNGRSEQTYPGFGIGLFIAKSIMERHNGSITLESEKGKGSTFTFNLPIASEIKNK